MFEILHKYITTRKGVCVCGNVVLGGGGGGGGGSGDGGVVGVMVVVVVVVVVVLVFCVPWVSCMLKSCAPPAKTLHLCWCCLLL